MAGYSAENRGSRNAPRAGATVSRRLKAAGFSLMPADRRHKHRGITVRGAEGMVSVLVDLGATSRNTEAAEELLDTIGTWSLARHIRTVWTGDRAVYVRFDYGD